MKMRLKIPLSGVFALSLLAIPSLHAEGEDERGEALQRAHFTDPLQNGAMPGIAEMKEGPASGLNVKLEGQKVYCRYKKRPNGGHNPKFRCYLSNAQGYYLDKRGKVISSDSPDKVELKVKYKQKDNPNEGQEKDIYTQVFASRLMWTLGFPSDRVYSTEQVTCFDCSDNPFYKTEVEEGHVAHFPDAAIQIKYPGKNLFGEEAWSFLELKTLRNSNRWTNEQKTEFDALALLMSFLVHSSNLAHQQALKCVQGKKEKCPRPLAYVRDNGSVLGAQLPLAIFSFSKGDLKDWSDFPVFKDQVTCHLKLHFGHRFHAHYTSLNVSEEGRLFLLDKFKGIIDDPALGDLRLRTLFELAKFAKADTKLAKRYGFLTDEQIIDMWVSAFKQKVREIESARCPHLK
ncbi:MAG: hypothetical protein HYW48_08960 [Deltaproteobacteria bacterium]|nr:hypothetical protein [Deltaproteobacteria bacterium]